MTRIAKGSIPPPTPLCFSEALDGSRYTIREREAYQRVWNGERGVRAGRARNDIEKLIRSRTLNSDEMVARLLPYSHLLDAGYAYAYSSESPASFSCLPESYINSATNLRPGPRQGHRLADEHSGRFQGILPGDHSECVRDLLTELDGQWKGSSLSRREPLLLHAIQDNRSSFLAEWIVERKPQPYPGANEVDAWRPFLSAYLAELRKYTHQVMFRECGGLKVTDLVVLYRGYTLTPEGQSPLTRAALRDRPHDLSGPPLACFTTSLVGAKLHAIRRFDATSTALIAAALVPVSEIVAVAGIGLGDPSDLEVVVRDHHHDWTILVEFDPQSNTWK